MNHYVRSEAEYQSEISICRDHVSTHEQPYFCLTLLYFLEKAVTYKLWILFPLVWVESCRDLCLLLFHVCQFLTQQEWELRISLTLG